MRFLHISDLHLGKMIHGVSMLENGDQPYWIDRFLSLSAELHPKAVLISGDVYDRGSPSGAAVALLSRLVEGLADMDICVMLTAGNHDSGQRLAFAQSILARNNVHIAGTVERTITHVTLKDEFGPVTFWLMPYVFPAAVAQVLEDDAIRDYDTAVRRLLEAQEIDESKRNVIIAHQNVTAFGEEGGHPVFMSTDDIQLGAKESVRDTARVLGRMFSAIEFRGFKQKHVEELAHYSGVPVINGLSVELGEKGTAPQIETRVIPPLHPMREMRGTYEELRELELARDTRGEYLRLVITDQPMTPEFSDFFQSIAEKRGSVLMERVSEYRRFTEEVSGTDLQAVREKSLEELFADFWMDRSGGSEPDEADLSLLHEAGELLRSRLPDPRQQTAVDSDTTEALLTFLMRQEEAGK